MDYTEDQTHADIRQAVRTLCKAFPDEYWMEHDDSHEFPWEFYNAIAEGGWLGLTIPEEYGGGGLGVTEAAIVEQEIAASGAGMGGCSAVHDELSVVTSERKSSFMRSRSAPMVY